MENIWIISLCPAHGFAGLLFMVTIYMQPTEPAKSLEQSGFITILDKNKVVSNPVVANQYTKISRVKCTRRKFFNTRMMYV
jgi:hypothetical protein